MALPIFATQDDFVLEFGEVESVQLTDREESGDIDATVLNRALANASQEVASYINTRPEYALPLPNIPGPLSNATCNIARYRLYKDRAPEEVKQRYDDAVKWLKDVSAGRANLVFDVAVMTPEQVVAIEPVVGPVTIDKASQGVFSDATLDMMPGPWWRI